MLAAAYSIPGSLFRVFGGWLSDRIGARRVMFHALTDLGGEFRQWRGGCGGITLQTASANGTMFARAPVAVAKPAATTLASVAPVIPVAPMVKPQAALPVAKVRSKPYVAAPKTAPRRAGAILSTDCG